MKTFIGIASDHKKDVWDDVHAILKDHNPQAITLERHIVPINIGESITPSKNPRLQERIRELQEGCGYSAVIEGKKVLIKVNDLYVYGHPEYTLFTPSEKNATIDFAVKEGKPFYFVDWGSYFPNAIFVFENSGVRMIAPIEPVQVQSRKAVGEVNERNLFEAAAISYLFGRFDIVSHTGGIGHFDASTKPNFELGRELSKGLELQNLVNADTKIVYDLVNNRRIL